MKTRINDAGYWEYWAPKSGQWIATHRRAAERKLGDLRPGFHVHHIDSDKTNNRHSNLVEVHPKVHGRLHASPRACLRCGRDSHWAAKCYAKTFYDGTPIVD